MNFDQFLFTLCPPLRRDDHSHIRACENLANILTVFYKKRNLTDDKKKENLGILVDFCFSLSSTLGFFVSSHKACIKMAIRDVRKETSEIIAHSTSYQNIYNFLSIEQASVIVILLARLCAEKPQSMFVKKLR